MGTATQPPPRNIVPSDEELVRTVLHGETDAFNLLVRRYRIRLLRQVGRVIRTPVDAEDIVQEIFIKAYRALSEFRGDARFITWLYRIALNTTATYRKTEGRRPDLAGSAPREQGDAGNRTAEPEEIGTPESILIGQQTAAAINRALDEMPDALSATIALREFDERSYEEIAFLMDCPVNTVRSRLSRGREMLAAALKN